jgi:hypothetical protein
MGLKFFIANKICDATLFWGFIAKLRQKHRRGKQILFSSHNNPVQTKGGSRDALLVG